jgi:putative glutamine amidotransferase
VLRQNIKVKPRIGITYSQEIKAAPYAEAVRASGGEPVLISPESDFSAQEWDGLLLDGLLLAGGVDVDPALYGEERGPQTEVPNTARDSVEQKLLAEALQRNVPVLAICRGLQMLNVAQGGSLIQHMEGHEQRPKDKSIPAHSVTVETVSLLSKIFQTETIRVNSRHHQTVGRVADGLRVVAQATDGTVEALESSSHDFVLGVQWHPEDMAAKDPLQKKLFDAFISRARK